MRSAQIAQNRAGAVVEVARRALRDRRRALFWWSLGSGLYALFIVVAYPAVKDQSQLNDLMKDYPPELIAIFSGGETSLDITSVTGYLNSQLFSFLLPILLSILAIGFGASTLAGEEEAGTMELLLSYPVRRRDVVVQKAAVLGIQILVVVLVTYAVTFGLGRAFSVEVAGGNIVASLTSQLLLALVMGLLAMTVGATTGKRGSAIGVAAAVAAAGYLVNSLGPVVSWMKPLRYASPFYYATGSNPLADGFDLAGLAVLSAAALMWLGAAIWAFDRRDLSA